MTEEKRFRKRLVRFYKHYQPEKVKDVDRLMAQCAGKTENFARLMNQLESKYGPEPMVSDPKLLTKQVTALYEKVNPSKLETVPNLVKRTKGKAQYEFRLLQMIKEKYGIPEDYEIVVEDDDDESEEEVVEDENEEDDNNDDEEEEEEEEEEEDEEDDDDDIYDFGKRLTRYYEKYAPEKIGDVGKLVEKTNGVPKNEEKLMEMLVKKYGPEPGDSESEEEEEEENEMDENEDANDAKTPSKEEDDEEEGGITRKVVYCPVDGLPAEYSEYLDTFNQALPWLNQYYPNLVLTTKKGKTVKEYVESIGGVEELKEVASKSSTRGGAGRPNQAMKKKGGAAGGDQVVTIERTKRQKRKFVTSVFGLDSFGIKLKDAKKSFSNKFASSTTVTKHPNGTQSVDIQGDWVYDLPEYIIEVYSNIQKSNVMLNIDGKKQKAF